AMGTIEDEPPPVASAAENQTTNRLQAASDATMQLYFAPAVMSDSDVVRLVNAMIFAVPGERVLPAAAKLSPDAMRRFLAGYWSRVDPTPGTPKNELLEEYTRRVEYANRTFTERDIGRPGVRTDRGRIYLKYGAPDDRLARPLSAKGAIEVWKFTRQRNLKYAFLDETGFQHFNLVYTTDPNERSAPDWETRIADQQVVNQILGF